MIGAREAIILTTTLGEGWMVPAFEQTRLLDPTAKLYMIEETALTACLHNLSSRKDNDIRVSVFQVICHKSRELRGLCSLRSA